MISCSHPWQIFPSRVPFPLWNRFVWVFALCAKSKKLTNYRCQLHFVSEQFQNNSTNLLKYFEFCEKWRCLGMSIRSDLVKLFSVATFAEFISSCFHVQAKRGNLFASATYHTSWYDRFVNIQRATRNCLSVFSLAWHLNDLWVSAAVDVLKISTHAHRFRFEITIRHWNTAGLKV